MKCELCKKRKGQFNNCNGDYKTHYHGAIHLFSGGLKFVCEECAKRDKVKWDKARKK